MSPAIITRMVGIIIPIRIPADFVDSQALQIAQLGVSVTQAFREMQAGPMTLVRLKAKDTPKPDGEGAPEGFEASGKLITGG